MVKSPTPDEQVLKRWLAEERHFTNLSRAFIERNTRVFGIPPYAPEIGYTYVNTKAGKTADIHVCRLHDYMLPLSERERSFFRLGVYAHEALHQIFTNFDETDRLAKTFKRSSEQKLFRDISNIVEDTRIEFFAHQAIGGEALSALNYTIRQVYMHSEIGKETHPVSQALNALIQLGDMGVVKGKFTIPEAYELFSRIVPLFEKAVRMPVCAEALKVSVKITEIVCEYMDFEFEDFLDELFKMARDSAGSGKGSDADSESDEGCDEGGEEESSEGPSSTSKSKRSKAKKTLDKLGISDSSSDESDETEGDSSSLEGSSSKNKDDETKGDISDEMSSTGSGGSKEDADDICELPSTKKDLSDILDFGSDDDSELKDETSSSSKKSEDFDAEGLDDVGLFDDVSEPKDTLSPEDKEALDKLNELIQEAFEEMSESEIMSTDYSDDVLSLDKTIKEEIISAEKDEKSKASDSSKISIPDKVKLDDPFVHLLVNKKMEPQNPETYDALLSKVSHLINSTAKAVERAMKQQTDEKERHTSGDINLHRYHDRTYTSARVFDKRRDPLTLGDTCITVFVDESGSMDGAKALAARETAILLAEVCAKLKIPCYVAGYSADEFTYEVDLRHYVTWKNTKADRTSLVSLRGRRENRDGASIRAITAISKKRPEERKILFVLSDGQPCANGYRGKGAILDTKNAIREARKVYETVVGVSIGTADTETLHEMYGNDFVSVTKPSELSIELSKLFKKMFKF